PTLPACCRNIKTGSCDFCGDTHWPGQYFIRDWRYLSNMSWRRNSTNLGEPTGESRIESMATTTCIFARTYFAKSCFLRGLWCGGIFPSRRGKKVGSTAAIGAPLTAALPNDTCSWISCFPWCRSNQERTMNECLLLPAI